MRTCAKLACQEGATATVALRYRERVLVIADLLEQRDPNLIDLCVSHADSLVEPYGWRREDGRVVRALDPSTTAASA